MTSLKSPTPEDSSISYQLGWCQLKSQRNMCIQTLWTSEKFIRSKGYKEDLMATFPFSVRIFKIQCLSFSFLAVQSFKESTEQTKALETSCASRKIWTEDPRRTVFRGRLSMFILQDTKLDRLLTWVYLVMSYDANLKSFFLPSYWCVLPKSMAARLKPRHFLI